MIVFDLRCQQFGHVFEAWFGSSSDYESQCERGLLSCPLCGDTAIEKAVMAPAVSPKGNQTRAALPDETSVPSTAEPAADNNAATPFSLEPDKVKHIMTTLAKMQAEVLKSSTWVGKDFASQARAMHDGEIDPQPIHGQARLEEARDLLEEGIDIMPLPFPIRPPGMDN